MIGISDYDGVTSPAYDILRAYKPIESKFYHYLFRNPICLSKLKQHSKGIMEMRLRLYFDEFGNIKIPFPSLEEQERIIKFLDRKCEEVERSIELKQRLIALLDEQKSIVINQAVTKGLNPNAPMKDSGIDWLGDIPTHWELKKLKLIADKIGDGIHSTPIYVDNSEYKFINGNNLVNGKIIASHNTKSVSKKEYEKYFISLTNNTLLLSINGTIGNVAFYNNEKIILGKSAAYIILKNNINIQFIYYFLNSISVKNYFKYEVTGTTIFNLSLKSIRSLLVIYPSIYEQEKIVEYLEEKTAEIEELKEKTLQQIEKLKEFKQILIAEAVTGKIKV